MADIQYLNYGDLQIELLALLTALADQVLNYVQGLSWSKKRKEKFMSAYSDIMNRGIIGASNNTGLWMIDVKGDPFPFDLMDRKDKEMYQEAAYFIQQQMAGLPTKSSEEKKKEEEKKDLPTFNNKEFVKGLVKHISYDLLGGRDLVIGDSDGKRDTWNYRDARDKNGLRGRENRAKLLAKYLRSYSDSITEDKYNFEGSPFLNLEDFKSRINDAIAALETKDTNDDMEALNRIGLSADDWFYDGSRDPSGKAVNGQELTYGLLAEFNQKLLLDEQAKLNSLRIATQNNNRGVLRRLQGVHAVDARNLPQAYLNYLSRYGTGLEGFNAVNNEVAALLDKGNSVGLTSAEKRQLGNFLYYIRNNNPNAKNWRMSDLDWAEFSIHKNLSSRNKEDYIRLPWQTSDGKYTFADNKGNVYFLKPRNQLRLGDIAVNRSKAYYDYKNNFLKSSLLLNNEKPVLSLDKDILIADITSMLGDLVSLGGGWAGVGGGVTSLASDLYADIRRGKDTWDVIKNVGKNVAWGVAGVIPGAKLGKLTRGAARIYATLLSLGILADPEIQKSWAKLVNGESINAKDFENFKWTLHAITGGTNAVRGHLTERRVTKQVQGKSTVETKNGNKPLTVEQAKEINKIGGRKGLKAAEEAFKKATGEEAKEGLFSFPEEGRSRLNPNRYSQRLRNLTSEDKRLTVSKPAVNQEAVQRLLEIDKNKPYVSIIGNPFKAEYWSRNNPINSRFWTQGGPNRGGLTFALGRNAAAATTEEASETPKTPSTPKTPKKRREPLTREEIAEARGDYKSILNIRSNKGREYIWGKNDVGKNPERLKQTITLKGEDLKFEVKDDGRFMFNGVDTGIKAFGKNGNYLVRLKVKEIVRSRMKSSDKSKTHPRDFRLMVEEIKKLKKAGFLKHGGIITDEQIDNFLKQYK